MELETPGSDDVFVDASFTAGGTPYQELYADEYCSRNGPEQAREVFVGACSVGERLAAGGGVAVLELGFGLGLNLAETLRVARECGAASALRYVGVELHPIRPAQFADVHLAGGVDDDAARAVIEGYPAWVSGGVKKPFGADVRVLIGDAAEVLAGLASARDVAGVARSREFDVVYFDGFTPARNASLWRPEVFDQVARLTRRGAVAATYSSARPVRDEFERTGFRVARHRGFAGKRHRIVAHRD